MRLFNYNYCLFPFIFLSVSLNKETGKLEYNRILLNGQGDTFYGLTVAEAYKLPQKIIHDAYEIRNKYLHKKGNEDTNILNLKTSRYNSNKLIGGMCEKCGKNIGFGHVRMCSNRIKP